MFADKFELFDTLLTMRVRNLDGAIDKAQRRRGVTLPR
ncbi:hypothetical protein OB2597_06905 [Pseudooceanicola batsensis HTCC2597]|uniref:Uncharacterized protein n=1 Tax=Pseudooceanicola batsensis (strain ATCC BAA-863 / DSM 15984 / KCTC 12145 / HTCC2597) TaxID=252305 RepID=A3TTL6_PSEBH|nr:hypothetical protein OB2597_06905 [Pseudooceanicola batsensis HTCC2597]